ncbi:hypothetical protein SAY86_029225 [Trapa natans]|uniref:dual-specificity kinase n=1 Tax=Trapa natans TaxID=22666 RepID=A0AAN7M1U5_TRANT|nr:hypothetical protein SAY86_029225 [Trapa natans]
MLLAVGTFGRVLECWDKQTQEYVAIKVVRNIGKYRDAALIEVNILQHIAKNDRGNSRYIQLALEFWISYLLDYADINSCQFFCNSLDSCVHIQNWFDYRGHVCIVFEKLGPSLYDFLKRNRYHPFPVDLVREFGHQLLESVAYIHDLHLIHTDLKPENILLESSESVNVPQRKGKSSKETQFRCLPKSSAIKVIDFGSTTSGNQKHNSMVSTRHYRAPEVILGLGWNYPCDLWSVGCILVELCSGEALFQTHESIEHLAMMERVLGPLPEHMIRGACQSADKYFRRRLQLNWPGGATSRESIRAVMKLDSLQKLISRYAGPETSSLVDLLHGLLKYEPSERLTAREALSHSFFKNILKSG